MSNTPDSAAAGDDAPPLAALVDVTAATTTTSTTGAGGKKRAAKKARTSKKKAAVVTKGAGSDNDEEEGEAYAEVDPEREARIRQLSRLLDHQRLRLTAEYTPDKRRVQEVGATTFAKNGILPSTPCVVCKNPVMGACVSCYLIQHNGGNYAVHHDCFVCSHNLDQEHVCQKSPFVKDEDDSGEDPHLEGEHVCYIEATADTNEPMPVCLAHVDLKNLELPRVGYSSPLCVCVRANYSPSLMGSMTPTT
jgi:hypothetical protein